MTFSHNLIIPLAFMKSPTMNPHPNTSQYNHHPYPALHQLRGGSSVSDDIISTFKDELKKMRQDLKREAEMEYEATRQELQKKLGKKIMRKSDPLDLVGEEEDEILQVDDDEYEYIEEEIEVEVNEDEDEGEGEEEEIVVVEEEGEEEEEEHEHNDDGDWSTEDFAKEEDLESSHSRFGSKEEDEKEPSDDLTSIPTNTLEDYSAIDTASDSQRIDKDYEGLMEDNAGHEEEEEEEESEPSRDGIEPDKKQSIDAKKVGMDEHEYLRHIDNQDFLTNTATVNITDGNIGTMDIFEIGESEEIDGNVGMSEEEQGATNNIRKEHGAKSSKKDKSVGKDSTSKKKKKKKSKSGKQSKQKKRKSTSSRNSVELEKGSGSQIDSLAHDVALKTLPRQKSSLTTFVRAMIPTLITILLLILSHFMLEAIMKQFSPR